MSIKSVMRRGAVMVGVIACVLAGDRGTSRADERLVIRSMPSPAGLGSAQPRLIALEDGIAMSWLERYGQGHRLRWSRWRDQRWSRPVTIAQGDSFFVNWADFPSVRWLGGTRWAAHWLWKSGAGTYSYDVRLSQSEDDGRSWSRPILPHRDGTATEHGFGTLLRDDHGVRAVWLDGRNFSGPEADGNAGANMTVRTAVLAPNGRLSDEHELDDRSCECCATAAVRTARGVLVAYRDRGADEIRDIALVRHEHGRWTKPYRLHADGWKIAGCPVNGPAMDASGDRVVIAWYTAAADTPRVFAAFSEDGGRAFSNPIRIDGGDPLGRVGATLLPDGSALVSWLENGGGKSAIKVRRVSRDGGVWPPQIVAASSSARNSGFPQIVRSNGEVWFAWTESGSQPRVRIARSTVSRGRSAQ